MAQWAVWLPLKRPAFDHPPVLDLPLLSTRLGLQEKDLNGCGSPKDTGQKENIDP